jgi:hypothetical protein
VERQRQNANAGADPTSAIYFQSEVYQECAGMVAIDTVSGVPKVLSIVAHRSKADKPSPSQNRPMSALVQKRTNCCDAAIVRFVPLTSDLRLDGTAAKFASLFDEAGGGVRDMTEIDQTGEHA